jgi:hypothetical protein
VDWGSAVSVIVGGDYGRIVEDEAQAIGRVIGNCAGMMMHPDASNDAKAFAACVLADLLEHSLIASAFVESARETVLEPEVRR